MFLAAGAGRRSAAGEWVLWFALGGGPPDFWKVPGLPAVIRLGACAGRGSGSATRHRSLGLSGRLLFAAVDDDFFDLACRVSSPDLAVQRSSQ
jgi:hypothetical protein